MFNHHSLTVFGTVGFGAMVALGIVSAQAEDYSAGKTPAQLFASDCSSCHKTPYGLSKRQDVRSLAGFLREHYTTKPSTAASLAGYLSTAKPAAAVESQPGDRNGAAKPKQTTPEGAAIISEEPARAKSHAGSATREHEPQSESETARSPTASPAGAEAKPSEGVKPSRQAKPGEEGKPKPRSAARSSEERPGAGPAAILRPPAGIPAETARPPERRTRPADKLTSYATSGDSAAPAESETPGRTARLQPYATSGANADEISAEAASAGQPRKHARRGRGVEAATPAGTDAHSEAATPVETIASPGRENAPPPSPDAPREAAPEAAPGSHNPEGDRP